MSTTTHLISADEFWHMPADGMCHELVQGTVRTMAPSGSEHGAVGIRLAGPLFSHVSQNGLGEVFGAETGFLIARNPDSVRAPDIAFVSTARIPRTGIPQKFWPGAPDLAVEVVSPSDTLQEVEEKVADWLAAGTSLVWVVNPRRRSVTVYRTPSAAKILTGNDELDGEDVIPGFRVRIARLFP